ncbi:MAG: N-acetylmuramoyl-L-alanine amidase, partial [Chloroflexales bacterium]|nr:N-acetylmuramoyl-L-alanine amidase [Chloroflexales bacterium]
MRSRWLLLLALLGAGLMPASGARAQQPPQAQIAQIKLSSVVEWQNGTIGGLLISNNDGGELRLAADSYTGIFESNPLAASFAFNAVGAVWAADLPAGTAVALEVRATNTLSP